MTASRSTIIHTSTFRLVAIYLSFFVVSVVTILTYVYWGTAGLLERQTDATIRAEIQALADQYRSFGLDGVVATVQRRSSDRTAGVYIFATEAGKRLAGNMEQVPDHKGTQGWLEFPMKVSVSGVTQDRTARAFFTDLSGGYELVVGRDIGELKQFGDLIRSTLISAVLIALVLGLTSGFFLSRNFLRRIDAITDASRTIMAGDLASRMPISGSDDELDRLAASLNEMLDQIERLMTAMREVSSNVAHDLKTPLTRLRARAESALRSDDKTDYRAALLQTIDESEHLLATFDALLSIARAESGEARTLLHVFDAQVVVEDIAELYQPMVEEEGGRFTVETYKGLFVMADQHLLAQALTNLIDNAIKYGAADDKTAPQISITAKRNDTRIEITVADHGPGVPEADRSRVLERFVRLEASRTKPGNGLGLSLVAGIMKLHHGAVTLEDNHPGLKVKLSIPLQNPPKAV